ncbi:MAG: glycosyltransferase family 2 protein [Bacteroidales bacterium]
MRPLFSIITVTYNAGTLLTKTIDSVARQTCTDKEYIIIDGASKDNTLEIIQKKSSEITNYISEPDKGIYDAMNKAFRQATGKYILFLNAGDTFHNDEVLEGIKAQIDPENEPDILYGETAITDEEGKFIAMRRLKTPEKLHWKSFKQGMLVCHQSFLPKLEICETYNLKYRYSADFDWCIRCMKKARIIHNTHLTVSNFLEGGVSTSQRKKSLKERYEIMSHYYGTIPTALRHLWFALRFGFAKYITKRIN